jgi:hypothetical protein
MTRATTLVVCLLAVGSTARAQDRPYNLYTPVTHLATLFTELYGPNGLIVDSEATLPGEQSHSAHFNSDFQSDFTQFSTALVNQLVTVPLPSPASGFTYRFDPSLGVFQRTTESFGPILAERAETIGAGRISLGFGFQRFSFDTIEDLDLGAVPAVFQHDNAQLKGGREDVVTTTNSIEARVNQLTMYASLGVTDRFDVSVAVPVVSTSLMVVSNATIQRLGTTNPLTHFFRQSDGEVGNRRLFTAGGSATGLGDVTLRLKQTVARRGAHGLAGGLDLRLPAGDEMDLLGTGAFGVTPFVVWSAGYGHVAPHANAGYTWNGSSVLAGNPATGVSDDFPDAVNYVAGAEVTANQRLTLVFDVLGRYLVGAERLVHEDFHALDGHSVFPNIRFEQDSYNTLSGSLGLKANLVRQLLLDVNVLVALDHHGLRDKLTPLVGLAYSF